MRFGISALVLLSVLSACGDDAGPGDAGTDGDAGRDAGPDSSEPDDGVADPGPPAPPVLTPCSVGTTEVARDGAPTECWPIAEPVCGPETARFLGEADCAPVGDPCPTGEFPEGVPERAVFVRAGATGGDGSEAAPLGTITLGLGAAGLGGTVVVARGTYDEILTVRSAVSIIGACAAETVVTATGATDVDGIVNVTGGLATLRNISFRDAPRGGVVVTGSGASAHLEGVVVDGTSTFGIYVDQGAEATLDTVAVRGVATSTGSGRFGDGLVVGTTGEVTASRLLIEGTHSTAVNVLDGSSLTASRLTIRDILTDDHGAGGRGLSVKAASVVTAEDVWIDGTRDSAVEARDVDTRLVLTRAVIADTFTHSDGERGRAVTSVDDAQTTLRQVVIRGFGDVGLIMTARSAVEAEDLVVREARGAADGDLGRFIEAHSAATFEGRRLHFEDAKEVGVSLADEGTRFALEDLTLRGVSGRVVDGGLGRGINVQFGASLELRRAAIDDTRNVAVFVDSGSAIIEDTDIGGVLPVDGTRRGRGFNIQTGASATLRRVRVGDALDVGLFASHAGTVVTAEDLTVRRVTLPPCGADESCGLDPGGVGVGVYQGAVCGITRIAVSDVALCGVHVAEAGELDIAGGVIRDSVIGACLQVEGYDVSRIDGVAFEGNGTPLEATSLPVPDGAAALGP